MRQWITNSQSAESQTIETLAELYKSKISETRLIISELFSSYRKDKIDIKRHIKESIRSSNK